MPPRGAAGSSGGPGPAARVGSTAQGGVPSPPPGGIPPAPPGGCCSVTVTGCLAAERGVCRRGVCWKAAAREGRLLQAAVKRKKKKINNNKIIAFAPGAQAARGWRAAGAVRTPRGALGLWLPCVLLGPPAADLGIKSEAYPQVYGAFLANE